MKGLTVKEDIILGGKPILQQIKGDSNYFHVRNPVGGLISKSPITKAISSIGSEQTFAISSTKRWTIGLPAIGINGFGVVNVCGRKREPRPAIGIIIFILL